MQIIECLEKKSDEILDEATEHFMQSRPEHYKSVNPEEIRRRLQILRDHVFKTVATGSYRDLIAHAQKVAADRYAAGCSLSEVQTAFDVLEETIWDQIRCEARPDELAASGWLIDLAVNTARGAVARTYFSLIANSTGNSRGHHF